MPSQAGDVEDEAAIASAPTLEDTPSSIDEAAESAFRAEARERGETVTTSSTPAESVEEPEPKTLPKLDDLVARIPSNVRDTLEELFRARFVSVKRIPKKALK